MFQSKANQRVALIIVCLLISSCSYNKTINLNIEPTTNIANPIKFIADLFITHEIKSLSLTDRAAPLAKYTYHVGPALESIITKAVNRVFEHVEVIETYPASQMINDRK
ncbi:MAG: hypothetical protein OXP71_04760 [Candidatus Poribacteria bacterium]|nr:hypothetical protein [Candidatus Poribacteria bacterium]